MGVAAAVAAGEGATEAHHITGRAAAAVTALGMWRDGDETMLTVFWQRRRETSADSENGLLSPLATVQVAASGPATAWR